mgnify:CR=1 FL=1
MQAYRVIEVTRSLRTGKPVMTITAVPVAAPVPRPMLTVNGIAVDNVGEMSFVIDDEQQQKSFHLNDVINVENAGK